MFLLEDTRTGVNDLGKVGRGIGLCRWPEFTAQPGPGAAPVLLSSPITDTKYLRRFLNRQPREETQHDQLCRPGVDD